MDRSEIQDMFEPFDKLIEVEVCGIAKRLPENNSILRGLQFLNREEISYGDFCWNGECLNCQVWIKNGEKDKMVMACRTDVYEGMEIVRLGETIEPMFEEINKR
jgi:predicted molibdopterin-dependent oxidoreductase YjgC